MRVVHVVVAAVGVVVEVIATVIMLLFGDGDKLLLDVGDVPVEITNITLLLLLIVACHGQVV